MSTKTCPECGAEVPQAANRCKECFHDFTEEPRRGANPILLMLGVLALMGIIGTVTFALVLTRATGHDVLIDQPNQSVVFTTQYRSGPVTERVYWKDIASVEHVTKVNGNFEVVAVTLSGDRYVLDTSDAAPLVSEAEQYAEKMGKPMILVDHSPGFRSVKEQATAADKE